MLSKLVPRAEASECSAFVYPIAGVPGAPARSVPERVTAVPDGDDRDNLQRRLESLKRESEERLVAVAREAEARGRAQAAASIQPVIERMNQTLQDLIASKPRFRKEVEEEAVRLALAIARRILRRELSVDPAALEALVQVAFERLARQDAYRVTVHPDQLAPVRNALAQITSRQIDIVPDPSRESGTLLFETSRGTLDASIESQLREIELGLADRLKWR